MAVTIDKQGGQYINWVFTLNNYTQGEIVVINSLVLTNTAKYVCYGKEKGESGTPHLQGYIELVERCRLAGIKKILGNRVHASGRMGTQQTARDYCRKGEQTHAEWVTHKQNGPNFGKNADFVEFGRLQPQSGCDLSSKENLIQENLKIVRDKIKAGATEKELYLEEPLMCARFPKYVSKLISWQKPPVRENLKVELHVGPTRSGKTFQAFARFPDLYNMPVKSGNTLWFNGYSGEKVVLLDDFKGGFGLDQFLRLTDKYPIQVESKGDCIWFNPDLIIITSNFEEVNWYDYARRQEHYLALKARITSRYQWNKRTSIEMDEFWVAIPQPAIIPNSTSSSSEELSEELSYDGPYDTPPTVTHEESSFEDASQDLLKL